MSKDLVNRALVSLLFAAALGPAAGCASRAPSAATRDAGRTGTTTDTGSRFVREGPVGGITVETAPNVTGAATGSSSAPVLRQPGPPARPSAPAAPGTSRPPPPPPLDSARSRPPSPSAPRGPTLPGHPTPPPPPHYAPGDDPYHLGTPTAGGLPPPLIR